METKRFFGDRCNDTQFLVKNEISIVYTSGNVENDDLNPTDRKNVYLLDYDLVKEW